MRSVRASRAARADREAARPCGRGRCRRSSAGTPRRTRTAFACGASESTGEYFVARSCAADSAPRAQAGTARTTRSASKATIKRWDREPFTCSRILVFRPLRFTVSRHHARAPIDIPQLPHLPIIRIPAVLAPPRRWDVVVADPTRHEERRSPHDARLRHRDSVAHPERARRN